MILREYQEKTLKMLDDYLKGNQGNPCIVLPTGAGKSVVIAEFCKRKINENITNRILMLTHVKELVEQNAEKMIKLWPNAPLGVCSAGLGRREFDEAITFASVQTLYNNYTNVEPYDYVIIDEAHTVSHKDEGRYREVLGHFFDKNNKLRIIGLTATPYRLGHGLITDAPTIFSDLIEPTSIPELQALGFLAGLKSKNTDTHFDLSHVHTRGGEYVESELQKAVDDNGKNREIAEEIIKRAVDKKSWLIFCSGVEHAKHMRDALRTFGVVAETVTGETLRTDRDMIL
jgi:DNA repair protein RadD